MTPGAARWSDVEHRVTPSGLAPQSGWAMDNARIARELRETAAQAAEPIRRAGADVTS
ncbi:hypothetical protein [Streptomyces sp. NPDC051677]|uniref:hypothetical protein n=1 Tax=Streptomyces sp. NPDC051677 TaxID=3365669 RepID=UPI0037D912E8